MKKISKILAFGFLLLIFGLMITINCLGRRDYEIQHQIDNKLVEGAKKATVTISNRITLSAYEKNLGNTNGTGFIVDKERGFIVTNQHVAGLASIGTYYVNFYNGQKAQAKLLYYDIWQDYAILEVNPQEIPLDAKNIVFSKKKPKINQEVIVVSNAESIGFSVHSGHISTLYDISGNMPQCSYIINLNSAGGASGSPILIAPNEAVGVLYGGGQTYILALHGEYVERALDALRKGELPRRRHIGALLGLYSMDDAVKYRGYNLQEAQNYLKKFPDSHNKVLEVQSVIRNTPAHGILKSGDLVLAVNAEELGGNLAIFDRAFDESTQEEIKVTIFRTNEGIMEKTIKLYDVNKNKINKMIDFAGAIFFEADDYMASISGIPVGSLTLANMQDGSSLNAIPYGLRFNNLLYYRLAIKRMGGEKVNSLNDLLKVIPGLIKKRYITVEMRNHLMYYPIFGNTPISEYMDFLWDIDLASVDNRYRNLEFDFKTREWKSYEMGGDDSPNIAAGPGN